MRLYIKKNIHIYIYICMYNTHAGKYVHIAGKVKLRILTPVFVSEAHFSPRQSLPTPNLQLLQKEAHPFSIFKAHDCCIETKHFPEGRRDTLLTSDEWLEAFAFEKKGGRSEFV